MIQETWDLWVAGGWLMIPLALLGIMIYFAIFELYLYMKKNNYYRTSSDEFGHWVDSPTDAKGTVREMIDFTQTGVTNVYEVKGRFEELRAAYLPPLTSRIVFCTILVGAAPLTGLLGTVIGMLGTFFGLSVSSGGNTIDLVAGGISEALVTTQTGLVLAIPAYVLISVLRKQTAELEHFFTQLEIMTILKIEKKRAQSGSLL